MFGFIKKSFIGLLSIYTKRSFSESLVCNPKRIYKTCILKQSSM